MVRKQYAFSCGSALCLALLELARFVVLSRLLSWFCVFFDQTLRTLGLFIPHIQKNSEIVFFFSRIFFVALKLIRTATYISR